MAVRDSEIFSRLDKIKAHYCKSMNNSLMNSIIFNMDLDHTTRTSIEMITERLEVYKDQGYRYDELYMGIYSLSVFIYKVRVEILPDLKTSPLFRSASSNESILMAMAADNIRANLDILADELNELYLKVVHHDIDSHNIKSPVYTRMAELDNLGQLLTSTARGLLN